MKSWLHRRRRILLLPAVVLAFAAEPAFTQPAAPDTANLQARIDAAAASLGSIPRFKRLSAKDRQQVAEFVAGNMLFVLLHELAHATTTQMGLPILGKKEDAADAYAVTRLIKLGSGFSDRVLVAAGKGFFLSGRRDEKTGDSVPYYDEHGLDQQRGYDVVCLMVGTGQDKYKALADETNLPKERQKTCAGDFNDASGSWDQVLKPHLRAPDQERTKIDVVYGEGKGPLAAGAQALRSIKLLETVADRISDALVWPAPFTLEMLRLPECPVGPRYSQTHAVLRVGRRFRRPLSRFRQRVDEQEKTKIEMNGKCQPSPGNRPSVDVFKTSMDLLRDG